MARQAKTLDEFALIARLFAPLAAGYRDAYGLEDDVAYLDVERRDAQALLRPGEELVIKTDAIVAGVHFPEDEQPELVARKLLRVNLSDLAAKGARPLVYTLAAMLPQVLDLDWLDGFAAGLRADQEAFHVALVGGDTTATPGPLALSLTILGAIASGQRLLRSAARPGDGIFVSGTIGDGALGLKALKGELSGLAAAARAALIDRYRLPLPRLELGARLGGLAHAAMDISDGLVGDLGHICETSRVAAVIEAALVPLSAAARQALVLDPGLIGAVLGGGDDYELLFTAPVAAEAELVERGRACSVAVTRIGAIRPGAGVRVVDRDGSEITVEQTGYRHF